MATLSKRERKDVHLHSTGVFIVKFEPIIQMNQMLCSKFEHLIACWDIRKIQNNKFNFDLIWITKTLSKSSINEMNQLVKVPCQENFWRLLRNFMQYSIVFVPLSMFIVNNKGTSWGCCLPFKYMLKLNLNRFWCFYSCLWEYIYTFFSISILDFKQRNTSWVWWRISH